MTRRQPPIGIRDFRTIRAGPPGGEFLRRGPADMVVFHDGQVFVFEPKVVHGEDGKDAAEQAIGQIQDKGYVVNTGPALGRSI